MNGFAIEEEGERRLYCSQCYPDIWRAIAPQPTSQMLRLVCGELLECHVCGAAVKATSHGDLGGTRFIVPNRICLYCRGHMDQPPIQEEDLS